MSMDEKFIAIIAAYAYTAINVSKEKKVSRTITPSVREEAINLWRLGSRLEVMLRRVL